MGAPTGLALGLALCLALSPPLLIVSLRQGRNVDPATVAVMVAAVLFMIDERPRALAVTLAIGALTRESAMFLIPLAYAIWAERLVDTDALRREAIVSAPAIVIYLALRLAIPTVGREQVAGYGGSLLGGRVDVLRDGFDGSPRSCGGCSRSTGRCGSSPRWRCATCASPSAASSSSRCASSR